MATLNVSKTLKLPIDSVVNVFGVVGIRGSGKTHTASVIAEEMLTANLPTVIIDPLDVWWGLRSSVSGKGPGLPINILGGDHGDIPLSPTSGAVVARFVVENALPCILSIGDFGAGAQRRFVAEFAGELYKLKNRRRDPVQLIIDEADDFAPQRVSGDTAKSFAAVDRLVRRGRSRGIGVTMITQRPAAINKDVLTQIAVMLAHRVTSPQDRKAIGEWLSVHPIGDDTAFDPAALSQLTVGECYVWSPEWLEVLKKVKIRPRRTFDSSATPKVGQRAERPSGAASVDLEALQVAMAETIAQTERDDPVRLRAEISELRRELRAKDTGADQAAAVGQLQANQRALQAEIERQADIIRRLNGFVELVRQNVPAIEDQGSVPKLEAAIIPRAHEPAQNVGLGPEPFVLPPDNDNNGSLPTGERAILAACIQHSECTRKQLTVLTGYKRRTRDAYIQRLAQKAYVIVSGPWVRPTGAGEKALPTTSPLPVGSALRDHWLARLPAGEAAVLRVAIAHYPNAVSRAEISDRTEYKRRTRDAYVQRLTARQLVSSVGAGEIVASRELFE